MMWALWIRSTLSTSWLIIGDELLRDCYVSKPGFQPWFSLKNSWNVGSSCPQDGLPNIATLIHISSRWTLTWRDRPRYSRLPPQSQSAWCCLRPMIKGGTSWVLQAIIYCWLSATFWRLLPIILLVLTFVLVFGLILVDQTHWCQLVICCWRGRFVRQPPVRGFT